VKSQKEIASGKDKILWRVSSTLFSHFRHDINIAPLPELSHLYNSQEALLKYKPMTAFENLMRELSATGMA